MSSAWRYGTVVRVDPEKHPQVPQPDNRRWMVVSFDDRSKWTLAFIGEPFGGTLVHFDSMTDFMEAVDDVR